MEKQTAIYDHGGGIVEHYGKIWDYKEHIFKTNPMSIVKMDVDECSYGRTYFYRFYVCLKAMKDGWNEGCRRVVGLNANANCNGEKRKRLG